MKELMKLANKSPQLSNSKALHEMQSIYETILGDSKDLIDSLFSYRVTSCNTGHSGFIDKKTNIQEYCTKNKDCQDELHLEAKYDDKYCKITVLGIYGVKDRPIHVSLTLNQPNFYELDTLDMQRNGNDYDIHWTEQIYDKKRNVMLINKDGSYYKSAHNEKTKETPTMFKVSQSLYEAEKNRATKTVSFYPTIAEKQSQKIKKKQAI